MFRISVFWCFIILFNAKVISGTDQQSNVDDTEKYLGQELLEVLGISQPTRLKRNLPVRNSALEFLMDTRDDPDGETFNRYARSARYSEKLVTHEDTVEIERCNNIITFLSEDSGNTHMDDILEFIFDISDIPKGLTLKSAELKIYKNISSKSHTSEDTLAINVFSHSNQSFDDRNALDQINVKPNYRGWLEFDITNALEAWLSEPKGTFGFYIRTNVSGGVIQKTDNVGLIGISGEEKYKPFMMGCFKGPELIPPVKSGRLKRSITSGPSGLHAPNACQKMNFTVRFKELKWDWIIAPQRFEAFFCSGDCSFPLGAGVNPTNHAIVQTLMHLKHTHIPKPQCAPTQLSSISVIYVLNDNAYNRKNFNHIVAENCGCQ